MWGTSEVLVGYDDIIAMTSEPATSVEHVRAGSANRTGAGAVAPCMVVHTALLLKYCNNLKQNIEAQLHHQKYWL